jgi:sugar lactone lactonase YvrE
MKHRRTHQPLAVVAALTALATTASAQTVTRLIDATGDGAGNPLSSPADIAVDGLGNAYVAGVDSHNVFRISPEGAISRIIDASGDGVHALASPGAVAADALGNVYVAGAGSDNVFMISPEGAITRILDATGDGTGNTLDRPSDVATDGSGNVYVAGGNSDNVLAIAPGGAVTEIIDATGDGAGNALEDPRGVAADGSGNVYVVGEGRAFRIASDGTITKIIGMAAGFGESIAVSGSGNVYVGNRWQVTGSWWFVGAVYRITPAGATTVIYGDETNAIAVDGAENVYVTVDCSAMWGCTLRGRRVAPDGEMTDLLHSDAGGAGFCGVPSGLAADAAGNVYVTSRSSDNAFEIADPCPADVDHDGAVGLTDLLSVLSAWGACPGCPADVDGDDDVGFPDLLAVLIAWGSCP